MIRLKYKDEVSNRLAGGQWGGHPKRRNSTQKAQVNFDSLIRSRLKTNLKKF